MSEVIEKYIEENIFFESDNYKKVFRDAMEFLGVETEEALDSFMSPSLADFNDPHLMKDMDKAVKYLKKAIDSNNRICLFGDYDADGVTSTALFVRVLRELKHNNFFYFIPDRQKDGYGISEENIQKVIKEADLVITADNGIREIDSLHDLSVPVILTDHHDPFVGGEEIKKLHKNGRIIKEGEQLMAIPDVEAIINPKRIDCDYPNESLAGVGVLFKLFQGLYKELGKPQKDLLQFLDLVAAGTVADLVPQFDKKYQDTEVRLMTALGIQMMNENPSVWVQNYKAINQKDTIVFADLGFSLGPNLNAPSRMGSAYPAVTFLIEDDFDLSRELAAKLKDINEERKKLQQRAIEQSKDSIFKTDNVVITILDEEFDSGIAGLVAGYHEGEEKRPSITFCQRVVDGEKILTGSCRSIDGVSIINALTETAKDIGQFRFGGHDQAAGLSLEEEKIDQFKEKIDEKLSVYNIQELSRELDFDLELPISKIEHRIVSFIDQLYVPVTFVSKENTIYSPPMTLRNPDWARVFLEKDGVRYQAMNWKKTKELIDNYQADTESTISVSYQLSFFRDDISISITEFKFD